MKVCFFGLGSIGRRHLDNLSRLCAERGWPLQTHAWRSTDSALPERTLALIDKQIHAESELDDDYDIAFITNPTSLHYETILRMIDRCKSMFIEKPLFDSTSYSIEALRWRSNGVYEVAAPLRHTAVFRQLSSILRDETPYSVRAICSSYLPDWRPGADYRRTYSASRREGGGVQTDLIHEWDYMTSLFGFPEQVHRLSGKYSALDIESDDLAVYIAAYPDKLVELHLDYFGRAPQRRIELMTGEGLIIGDFLARTVSFSDGRATIDCSEEGNDMYLAEMNAFLDRVSAGTQVGSDALDNMRHAYKVLKLATG